jgi:hypothetical protein
MHDSQRHARCLRKPILDQAMEHQNIAQTPCLLHHNLQTGLCRNG